MVKLLKSQTHSWRDLSDFRSKRMGKDESICRWLGWSDKPIGIDQLNSMIVDPSLFGGFGSQVRRKHVCKFDILVVEIFVGASSAIKLAIWYLRDGWTSTSVNELALRDVTWTTKVSLFWVECCSCKHEFTAPGSREGLLSELSTQEINIYIAQGEKKYPKDPWCRRFFALQRLSIWWGGLVL